LYEYIEKFGRLIVDYCIDLKPKEDVLIVGGLAGIEGIRSVFKHAVLRGAHPRVELRDELMIEYLYRYAPPELLEYLSPIDVFIYSKINALVKIGSPAHTKPLISIDPERVKLRTRATRKLTEIFLERESKGELKWVTTAFPTLSAAQEAGFSPLEWMEFVFKALKLHHSDPISAWREQARVQERVAGVLSRVSELRVESEDARLYLNVSGRTWINDDGKNNMPGGEVFTAPHEDSIEGEIAFTYPAVWGGVEVENVRLKFARGRVVEARASKGEGFLKKMLEVDEGASRVGEFAFGLNYDIKMFTKQILFDEKIGGTIHVALGAAYPMTGGLNKSSIHWDMIKDMRKGRIFGDNELIYENGRFLLDVL